MWRHNNLSLDPGLSRGQDVDAGFTIVELMIATLVFSVILLVVKAVQLAG